ncbi:MAG: TetR/AcrR family transcriptional regulator [Halomonadaceae bacterium]|nr:MAG: TetR/AcrR family transcriptional regulator [Halomonadaceae bacterium]
MIAGAWASVYNPDGRVSPFFERRPLHPSESQFMDSPQVHRSSKSEQRQEDILVAAALVFSAKGYRCSDVDEIAEKAGVGKGTVYRHFVNKETLFLATVEKAMADLSAFVNDSLDKVTCPLTQFRLAMARYLQYFDRHPGTVELFIQERAEFRRHSKPLYFVYQASHREKWLELYRRLADAGQLRVQEPEQALDLIGDLLFGAVFSHRLAGSSASLAARSESMMDMIFYGILTPHQ